MKHYLKLSLPKHRSIVPCCKEEIHIRSIIFSLLSKTLEEHDLLNKRFASTHE